MFEFVDLEDSFVLSWNFNVESQQLVFNLEASLWKGHQHYTKPLPNEFTCYKPARLIFEKATFIDGLLSMDKVKPSIDPDGSVDYGNIEELHQTEKNIYKISGDFGEVKVACENVHLDFRNI